MYAVNCEKTCPSLHLLTPPLAPPRAHLELMRREKARDLAAAVAALRNFNVLRFSPQTHINAFANSSSPIRRERITIYYSLPSQTLVVRVGKVWVVWVQKRDDLRSTGVVWPLERVA